MATSTFPSDPPAAALAEAERLAVALERRAMSASDVSFTIADARAPGMPLVWVNPAFTATTGYTADEVLGTNCRFLQGPATDREAVVRIREGVAEARTVGETLLNYRKDGAPFWNQLTISPVHDELGTLTHFVGVQADVTARVETARSREAALDAAISANHRLTTTRLVERLGELLGTEDVLAEAAQAVAEVFACWAVVVTYPDRRSRTDVASHDPALAEAARRLSRTPGWADRSLAAVDVLGGGAQFARPFDVTPDLVSPHADEEELAAMQELGLGSAMSVGLRARGRVVGVLAVVSAQPGFFGEEDAVMFEDLGHRIGLLLDNARLYERERDAAHTLQERMLPRLRPLDGLDVAVVYRPAGGGSSVGAAAVGGDWFEAIELPDGRVLLVVGDVVGHDMHAAAAMGQIRSALLTVASDGTTPDDLVERLDGLVKRFGLADVATCVVATLGPPAADGARELVYCRAGHPPPLLRTPDGVVRPLDGGLTTPVGVVTPAPVTAARLPVPAGSTLVLYTDGLVESRARGQREGIVELAQALRRAPADADAAAVRDHLLDQTEGRSDEDDTCLLVVRLPRGDEAAVSDGGAPPHA